MRTAGLWSTIWKFDYNFNFAARANPVPKPDRTGDYHRVGEHQMVDYGPASYVPADRWAYYCGGRQN